MSFTNEPAGTLLTEWSFASASYPTDWNGDSPPTLVDDAAAPESPPKVAQATYPVGFEGGTGPVRWWYTGVPWQTWELYEAWTWKCSDPWYTHPAGDKTHFTVSEAGGWTQTVILKSTESISAPSSTVPLQWQIYYPQLADNSHISPIYGSQPGTLYFLPNMSNPPVTKNSWHRVEHRCKVSTSATSRDGEVWLWIDGALVIYHANVNYPRASIVEWQIAPTWGGVGEVKPGTDYFWYDHVRLVVPSGTPSTPSSGTFTSFTVS